VYPSGPNGFDVGRPGLPAVSSKITIHGAGAATTIIERSKSPGLYGFRIFHVDDAGDLTLDGVTVSNGESTGSLLGAGPGFSAFDIFIAQLQIISCLREVAP
jgi:hypothetical protein